MRTVKIPASRYVPVTVTFATPCVTDLISRCCPRSCGPWAASVVAARVQRSHTRVDRRAYDRQHAQRTSRVSPRTPREQYLSLAPGPARDGYIARQRLRERRPALSRARAHSAQDTNTRTAGAGGRHTRPGAPRPAHAGGRSRSCSRPHTYTHINSSALSVTARHWCARGRAPPAPRSPTPEGGARRSLTLLGHVRDDQELHPAVALPPLRAGVILDRQRVPKAVGDQPRRVD